MSFLTIQYGSGILYKKIEILETDITYNDLKERICDDVFCREYGGVKVEKKYELFHKNEIINMDEEMDFHKNPLNIVFTTKYYKNDIIFINPLKDIENKTLENCKDDFDKEWRIIVFEENQTDELCLYAIYKDYRAICYMINQTDELCRYAIDKDYRAIGCVRNQTDELCRYAIDKDYRSIELISNPTNNICYYAINKDYRAIELISNQTNKICYYAINKSNGNALQYIKNQTYELCKRAININNEVIKFVKNINIYNQSNK